MNGFEYLGNISLGQYLPTGSPIHHLNPGIKLAGFSLLILALTLSKQMAGLGIAIAATIVLLLIAKIPLKFALRGLRSPLAFILILALVQLFMVSYQSSAVPYITWHFFKITDSGLYSAGMICIRFSGLVLLLTLSSATLSTLEIVHGLDIMLSPLRSIGIHTSSAAMVIQIMLRFLPSLALSAEKIAKSQASRGAAWGNPKANLRQRAKQLLPLLIPLFTINLQQADALANAMLARGYGRRSMRTVIVQYPTSWVDWIFSLLILGSAFITLFFSGNAFIY